MNIFKLILKILLVIIFILSATFNILIAPSSLGTLIFKHDDEKLLSIVKTQILRFDINHFVFNENQNILITKESSEEDNARYSYNFNFDNDHNVILEINENDSISYYKDGYLYKNSDNKSKEPAELKILSSDILVGLNVLQQLIADDIQTTETKSKIYFRFFDLGIKYSINEDDRIVTYIYSLDGDLKNIKIDYNSGKKEIYSITYDSYSISLPNLEEYQGV